MRNALQAKRKIGFIDGTIEKPPPDKREEEKVHQFIMGLDDARYGNIVTSIIGTDPLPDLATVYQKVIREEQRLKAARVRGQGSEAVGFVAKKDVSQESLAMVARFEASSGQSQRRVVCSDCGRTGHEKANCWQLVGFPEWYTERGKSSTRGASRGRGGYHGDMSGGGRGRGSGRNQNAQAHTAHATTSNSSVFPDFTPDQLRALSQLIQERTAPSNDKLSGKLYGDLILDTGASHT
ncbi:unnamed protein product [Arabidopsis halleri]